MNQQDVAEFKERIGKLMQRATRLAGRAARRGETKRAESLERSAAHWADALENLRATPDREQLALERAKQEEAERADLRDRLARFVAADLEVQEWDAKRAAFEAGEGEDPGPVPYTEADMEKILKR